MRIETFQQRLQSGKAVNHNYQLDGRTGIIDIWRHEDKFVLTWEEFAEGQFYNEQNYLRDEVHHFKDVEEIFHFLKTNKVNPTAFKP